MAKSTVSKLVPKVPSLPGGSRRQQYSASTKRSLVDVAEQLFTEHGYSATSLDAIVAGAEVTKGALYHHFSGKQALFEAVFERCAARTAEEIVAVVNETSDPWERALVGLRSFLEVVQRPAYRRVVVQDGPAVLGYERYREQEERTAFGVILEVVGSVLESTGRQVEDEMKTTFARTFFGALTSGGEDVAGADDQAAAAARLEAAIRYMVVGMQRLAADGIDPGDV